MNGENGVRLFFLVIGNLQYFCEAWLRFCVFQIIEKWTAPRRRDLID